MRFTKLTSSCCGTHSNVQYVVRQYGFTGELEMQPGGNEIVRKLAPRPWHVACGLRGFLIVLLATRVPLAHLSIASYSHAQ
jgi:hypothetical protein